MKLTRPELQADLRRLRSMRSAPDRALGDNIDFEERVLAKRLENFENYDPASISLTDRQAGYFAVAVQGVRRSHIPATFAEVNEGAIYSDDIEPNQKVIRLECIDDILNGLFRSFRDIERALASATRDDGFIRQFTDQFELYPGARPAFFALKSEVESDLAEADWLLRLRNRLGLGHYDPGNGQHQSFALMEYRIKDVVDEWKSVRDRGAIRPFAFPTVLDCKMSPFFFPGPANLASSFAVDLQESAKPPIREMLHMRITYRPHHLVRVGELVGRLAPIKVASVRDTHLERLRTNARRDDFGAMMAKEVDE